MSEQDLKKIINWNKQQREHEQIVQGQTLDFCYKIMTTAIKHDTSKWMEKEYSFFLNSHESLNNSKTGKDKEYQDRIKGEAIQSHIKNNTHHAEYWDAIGEKMPVHEIISMFFDWRSRAIQKGESMDGFWEYNIGKLKNQPHAIPIVTVLREEYEKGVMKWVRIGEI